MYRDASVQINSFNIIPLSSYSSGVAFSLLLQIHNTRNGYINNKAHSGSFNLIENFLLSNLSAF